LKISGQSITPGSNVSPPRPASELDTGAAGGEPHPSVGAASVHLRRAPDAGFRLRRLDQILGARLEADGSRLCRSVIEYTLTCFQSHDPAIFLVPVIAGPVANTEDAAQEGVQDDVDAVAERFQRDPADDE
jgi:hypothetical protein